MNDSTIIIVAGTPGVGKTSLSFEISRLFGCRVVEPSTLAVEKSLGVPDPERPGTLIIDEDALLREVKNATRDGCTVLATHYPSLFLDNDEMNVLIPFVVLLRTHPLELERRLTAKGWPRRKVVENVMAEALSAVAQELIDYDSMVIEVDTTGLRPHEAAENVLAKLATWDVGISIDWLSCNRVTELLDRWSLELDLNDNR